MFQNFQNFQNFLLLFFAKFLKYLKKVKIFAFIHEQNDKVSATLCSLYSFQIR